MFPFGAPQLIMGGVAISLLAASFGYGYHKGSVSEVRKFEAAKIALQKEVFGLSETIIEKNNKLLEMQEQQRGLINELEKEAVIAPGSANPGVSTTGGLQRLERRWATDSELTE